MKRRSMKVGDRFKVIHVDSFYEPEGKKYVGLKGVITRVTEVTNCGTGAKEVSYCVVFDNKTEDMTWDIFNESELKCICAIENA